MKQSGMRSECSRWILEVRIHELNKEDIQWPDVNAYHDRFRYKRHDEADDRLPGDEFTVGCGRHDQCLC